MDRRYEIDRAVRRAAHDFGVGPGEDDLSVLVLQAVAEDSCERRTRTSARADKA